MASTCSILLSSRGCTEDCCKLWKSPQLCAACYWCAGPMGGRGARDSAVSCCTELTNTSSLLPVTLAPSVFFPLQNNTSLSCLCCKLGLQSLLLTKSISVPSFPCHFLKKKKRRAKCSQSVWGLVTWDSGSSELYATGILAYYLNSYLSSLVCLPFPLSLRLAWGQSINTHGWACAKCVRVFFKMQGYTAL